ncbi:IS110 family transposase [Microbacterium sp. STF-2]|uniref:IS110 family transposase n=1 Tax=Microbacterium sp. STF-2 TaxID=3031132 RepID=UPI002AFF2378|nr:IS110 family transposase [Microbacterium sp. STF-2]MEA1264578.1 IS110 family transposase [Microbacterium sp. STF-2]
MDCHARTHTYAIIDPRTGEQLGCEQFPTTPPGIHRAIGWAARRTGGDASTLWAIEGVATYGAQIARAVADAGFDVVEAPQTSARARHGIGKSDPIDARMIAAATLGLDDTQLRQPRQDTGVRAALRTLVAARDMMAGERTMNINALTALLRVNDLGVDARKSLTRTQIATVTKWRERTETLETQIARAEAIRLARRIRDLNDQLDTNKADMVLLIKSSPAAPILEEPGIGPVTAAVVLTAWSHHGRVRSEAAFAALAGVNPSPASSGQGRSGLAGYIAAQGPNAPPGVDCPDPTMAPAELVP